MENNQNDKSNRQPDSKPIQETFEDGTKKKETNPANPTAKQNVQPGNPQQKNSTSTQDKTDASVLDTDEREEESTDSNTSE